MPKFKGPSKHFSKGCSNLELKIGRDLKGSKIYFCRNIGIKIKMMKTILSGTETTVTKDTENAEALTAFLGSVVASKVCHHAS